MSDVEIFINGSMSNFLHGLETGNIDMVDQSFESIKQLETEEFQSKIRILEDEYERSIEDIKNNALGLIKDNDKIKNFDELISLVYKADNDVKQRSKQFGNDIREFIIKWMKNKKTTM